MKKNALKILVVALVVVFGLGRAAGVKANSIEASPFGVNGWGATLKDAGIAWTRINIRWQDVEKEKGKFDFSGADAVVDKFYKDGIGIFPVLGSPPAWYRRIPPDYKPIESGAHKGWGDFPPNDLNAWGEYVYQTVKHFKGKIKYFEIWNEPHFDLFFNGGTVDDYAALLKVAYAQAKKANPDCRVVGLGGTDAEYARKVFERGGHNYMDIASIHIYNMFGHPPEKAWYVAHLNEAKKVVDEYKPGMEIWLTETGWPTHSGFSEGWMGVTPENQANFLVRSIVLSLSYGVKRIFWFSAKDAGDDKKNFEWNQGLLFHDGKQKPSYFAYAVLIQFLEGKTFEKKIEIPKVQAHVFTGKIKAVCVLWTIHKNISLKFKNAPEGVKFYAIDGKELNINDRMLPLSSSPVYLSASSSGALESLLSGID